MQLATSIETDNGEMIVKQVSVPIGLEELMEGLTKEVLLKKPKDIYVFASEYFAKLLELREKGAYKVTRTRKAQFASKQTIKEKPSKLKVNPTTSPPKKVSNGTAIFDSKERTKSFFDRRKSRNISSSSGDGDAKKTPRSRSTSSSINSSSQSVEKRTKQTTKLNSNQEKPKQSNQRSDNKNRVEEKIVSSKMRRTSDLDGVEIIAKTAPMVVKGMQRIPSKHSVESTKNKTTEACRDTESIINNEQAKIVGCKMTNSAAIDLIDHKLENKENINDNSTVVSSLKKSGKEDDSSKDVKIDETVLDKIKEDIEDSKSTEDDKKENADGNKGKSDASKDSVGTLESTRIRSGAKLEDPTESVETQPSTSIKSDDLEMSSSETIPAELDDISKNQPKENSSQNSITRKEEDSAETVAPTTVERVAKLEDVTKNRETETTTSEASNDQEKSASEQSKITMAKIDDSLEDKSKEVAATTLESGAKHEDATENREVTSEVSTDQDRNASEQFKITKIDDKLEDKPKEYPLQVTIEDQKEDNKVNENFIETGKSGAKLKSMTETVGKEADTFKPSDDEKRSVSEQSKVTETKTGSTSKNKPAEETTEEVKGENSFGEHSVETMQSSAKVVEDREKEAATPTASNDQENTSLEKTNTELANTGDTLKSNREENCSQSTAEERKEQVYNTEDSDEAVVPMIEGSKANLGGVTENFEKEAVASEANICQKTSASEQSKVIKAVIDDASIGNSNTLEETPKETITTTTVESAAKPKVMTENSENASNVSSGQEPGVSETSKMIKAQTGDTLEDKPKEVYAQNTTQQKKEVNHPIEDSIGTIVPTVKSVDAAQKYPIEDSESQTVEEVAAKKTTDSNVESPVEQINDKEDIIAQQSFELLRNSKHISKATEDFLSNEQNNTHSSFLHSSTEKHIAKENRNHSVASELASSIGGMHQELLRSIDHTNNSDQSKDEKKNLASEANEDDSIIVEAIEMKHDAKKSIEHNATEVEHSLQNLSNSSRSEENKSDNQVMSESKINLSENVEKTMVKKPEKDGNEVSTSTASPASTVQGNNDNANETTEESKIVATTANNKASSQNDKEHPQKVEAKNQEESETGSYISKNIENVKSVEGLLRANENATSKEPIVGSTENIDRATKIVYKDPKIDEDTSVKTDTKARKKRSVEDTGLRSPLLVDDSEKNQKEDEVTEKSCDVDNLEEDQKKSSGAIIQSLSAEKGNIEETKTNGATIESPRSIAQEEQDDKLTIRPKIEEANEDKRGCEENSAEINEKSNTSETKAESDEKIVLSQDVGLLESTEAAETDSKIQRGTNESLNDKNIDTTMKESGKEKFNKLEEIKKESSTENNDEDKNEGTKEKSVEGNNKEDENNIRALPGEKTAQELKSNDNSEGSSSSEEATNKAQIQADQTGKETITEIKSAGRSKAPTNLEKTDQTIKSVKEEEDRNKSENNVGLGENAVEIGFKNQFFREQTNTEDGHDKNNGDKAPIIKENITPEKSDIVALEPKETKKEIEGRSETSQTRENLIETKANQQGNEDNLKIEKLRKQKEEKEDNKVKQPFLGEDFISQEATLVEEKNINTLKESRKAELEHKRENGETEAISSKDFNDPERSTSGESKTLETKAAVTLAVESRENTDKSKSKSEKIEDNQPFQEATLVKEKDLDTLKESMVENKTENIGKKTISSKDSNDQQSSTSGKSKNLETKGDVTLEVESIENTDNFEKIEDKQLFLGESSISEKANLVEEKHINTPVISSKAELEDKTENGEKETISSKDSNDQETSISAKSKTPKSKEDATLEVESKENTDSSKSKSEKIEDKQPFLGEDSISQKATLVEEKDIDTLKESNTAMLENKTENVGKTSTSGKSKNLETKEDVTLEVKTENTDNFEKIEAKQPFLGENSISEKANLVEEKHINIPVSSSKAKLEDKTENGEKETISSKDSNDQETSTSAKSQTPKTKENVTLEVESKENSDNSGEIEDKQPFLDEDPLSKKANVVEEKHINPPISSSKADLEDKTKNGGKGTISSKDSKNQETSSSGKSKTPETKEDATLAVESKENANNSAKIEDKQPFLGEDPVAKKADLVEEKHINTSGSSSKAETENGEKQKIPSKNSKNQETSSAGKSKTPETKEDAILAVEPKESANNSAKIEDKQPFLDEDSISKKANLVEEKHVNTPVSSSKAKLQDKTEIGEKETISSKDSNDQETSISGKSKTPKSKEDATLEVESKESTDNSEKIEDKQPFLDEDPVSKKANVVEEKHINQEKGASRKSEITQTKAEGTSEIRAKEAVDEVKDKSEEIEVKQFLSGEKFISEKTVPVEEEQSNAIKEVIEGTTALKKEKDQNSIVEETLANLDKESSQKETKSTESKGEEKLLENKPCAESSISQENSHKGELKPTAINRPSVEEKHISEAANLLEEKQESGHDKKNEGVKGTIDEKQVKDQQTKKQKRAEPTLRKSASPVKKISEKLVKTVPPFSHDSETSTKKSKDDIKLKTTRNRSSSFDRINSKTSPRDTANNKQKHSLTKSKSHQKFVETNDKNTKEENSEKRRPSPTKRTKRSASLEVNDKRPASKNLNKNQLSLDSAKHQGDSGNTPKDTKIVENNLRQQLKKKASKMEDVVDRATAAVKIQALWRGFATRKAYPNSKKENTVDGMKIADAVIKIQALWRGFNVRNLKRRGELFGKTVETEATKTEDLRSTRKLREKKINSALKIQSLWRGYQVRKGIKDVNNKLEQIQEPSEVQRNAPTDEDIMKAATKIQANMRGYMVRKKLPKKPMMSIVEENSSDVKTEQIARSNTVDEPKCVQKFVPTLVDPEELSKTLDNSKNKATNDDATNEEGYEIPRNRLETKDSIDLSTNKQNLVIARLDNKDEIKCEIDDNYENLPTRPVTSNLSKQHTETDNDVDEIGGESKSSSRTHSCKSTSSNDSRQTVIFNDELGSESKAEREELTREHREQIEQERKTETKEESKQKEIEKKSVSSQGKEEDIETLTSSTKNIKNNQGSNEIKGDKDEKVDAKRKEIVKSDDGEHNSSTPNPQEQNTSVSNVDQKCEHYNQKHSELSQKPSLGLQKFLIDISKDGKASKPDSKINEDKSMESKAERRESVGSKDEKNDIIKDTVEGKTENRTANKNVEKKEHELLKTNDDIVVNDDVLNHSAKEKNMDKPKNGLIPSKITSVDEAKPQDEKKDMEKENGGKTNLENHQKSETLEKIDSLEKRNLELHEKEKQRCERNTTEGSTEMNITKGNNIQRLVEDQKSEIKKINKTEQPPNENAKTEKTEMRSIDGKDSTKDENLLESLGNRNSESRGEKNISLPSKTEDVSRDANENLENTTTEDRFKPKIDLKGNKAEDSIKIDIGNEVKKNEENLERVGASTANRNSDKTDELQDTAKTINKNEGATRVEQQGKMNHEEAQTERSDPLKDSTNEANLAEIQKEQVKPKNAISNENDQTATLTESEHLEKIMKKEDGAIKSSPESDHQLPLSQTSADNITLNSLPADNLENPPAKEVAKTTAVEHETKENQKDAAVVQIEEQPHREDSQTNSGVTSKSVSTNVPNDDNVEIPESEKISENDENSNDSIVKSDSPYNKVNSPLLEEEIEKFNEKIHRTILDDLDDDRISTNDPDIDALRIPLRELSDIKEEEENMKTIEDDKIRIEGDGEEINNKTSQVLNRSTNRGGQQHGMLNENEVVEQQQQQPTITNRDNLPITVQLSNEATPAGVQKLTSPPVSGSNDDDDDDDADNSDAADGRNSSKQAAQASSKDASSTITESDNFENPTIQRVDRDMDTTEKRNNINNNLSKRNMEAEAATKIQAGFRGYQVRKQLKNKHTTGDISNQRRLVRRKSSGQMKKNNQTTTATTSPRDIEEQSAVKIQAGVRGFLVRRRQKKEKSKETTSST